MTRALLLVLALLAAGCAAPADRADELGVTEVRPTKPGRRLVLVPPKVRPAGWKWPAHVRELARKGGPIGPAIRRELDRLGITVAGVYTPPSSGVTNPMTEDLDAGGYDVTGAGRLQAGGGALDVAADGSVIAFDATLTRTEGAGVFAFGGATSAHPALRKHPSTDNVLEVVGGDGSGPATIIRGKDGGSGVAGADLYVQGGYGHAGIGAGGQIGLLGASAAGANGSVTFGAGGTPWVTITSAGIKGQLIGCSLYHTGSDTSLSGGSSVAAPYNAEHYDSSDFHDTSTNNTRSTVPTGLGGTYLVAIFQRSNVTTPGTSKEIFSWVRKNGSTIVVEGFAHTPVARGYNFLSGVATVDLSAGDYVEHMVYAESGFGGSGQIDSGNATLGGFALIRIGD